MYKLSTKVPLRKNQLNAAALMLVLLLSGCGSLHPSPFSLAEKQAEVAETKQNLYSEQEEIDGPIDLYEAMARAVKYNLGYRLKIMDEAISMGQFGISKFSLLPKMTLSAGYDNRDNVDASVSESISTGQESLEASTSRDKDYSTANMSISWNILDFGVSYFQAKQQADKHLIYTERRRKALHNLVRDVRFAYWRAVAVQQLKNEIKNVITDSETAMAYARTVENEQLRPLLEILQYQKTLLEVTRQLESLQEELALAKIELARLMNLPNGTDFELSITDSQVLHVPQVKLELNELEDLALLSRPELAESGYQKRIDANETKKSIARLFPGITFRVSTQYDDNSYTINNSWIESGLQIAWNLVNLISAPATLDAAKMREEATELQQMTLSMAIISQVNIAYRQYNGLIKQYNKNTELEDINNRILIQMKATRQATTQSQVEEIKAATNAIMSKLQRYQTYANMQNAFGRVFAASGVDPLPVNSDNYDISTLKRSFKEIMISWEAPTSTTTTSQRSTLKLKKLSSNKQPAHKNKQAYSRQKNTVETNRQKTPQAKAKPIEAPLTQQTPSANKQPPKEPMPHAQTPSQAAPAIQPDLLPQIPGLYPQASSRLLTHHDLKNMSKKTLRILRNEIYARNSYSFKSKEMREYFQKQEWYIAKYNDVSKRISITERRNIDLIRSYEKSQ